MPSLSRTSTPDFSRISNPFSKLAMPMAAIVRTIRWQLPRSGQRRAGEQGKIVAVGRYVRDPNTDFAEVAFTTDHQWQNRGIGTFLLQYLIRIAKEKNIKGFTADVLSQNIPMMKVFSKSGYPVKTNLEYGVYELEIPFGQERRNS